MIRRKLEDTSEPNYSGENLSRAVAGMLAVNNMLVQTNINEGIRHIAVYKVFTKKSLFELNTHSGNYEYLEESDARLMLVLKVEREIPKEENKDYERYMTSKLIIEEFVKQGLVSDSNTVESILSDLRRLAFR